MTSRIFQTASFRLTAACVVVLSVSMCILGAFFYISIRESLLAQMRSHIEGEVLDLLVDYEDDGIDELRHDIRERRELNHPNRLQYYLENPEGRVIFDSLSEIPKPYGWHQVSLSYGTAEDSLSQELLLYSVDLADGYSLAVAASTEGLREVEAVAFRTFVWMLVLTVVLGLGSGVLLTRRFLARVDGIIKATERIGSGNLKERIVCTGSGDDFDQLATNINRMLDRIEHLVQGVKHVSTNIAHDLRTPIGHLRQNLERLRSSDGDGKVKKELLDDALAKVDEVLEIFAALLRIAELETGSQPTGFSKISLSKLLEEVAATYAVVAEENSQTIKSEIAQSVNILGDRQLLLQLFANLIENAMKHTPAGTTILLKLTHSNESIVATVADNGPGINEEHREDVFRPFFRADRNANKAGSGLGLSLVGAIAKLHSMDIKLRDNFPGLGVELRIAN